MLKVNMQKQTTLKALGSLFTPDRKAKRSIEECKQKKFLKPIF